MLIKAQTLKNFKLHSLDGEIGKVKEFYFDDHYWTIRYLVAETGNWLIDRQVLLSPHALGDVNKDERNIIVNLTKKQIEDSPSIENDKPVSKQFENTYNGYYGISPYWMGPYRWGGYPSFGYIPKDLINLENEELIESKQKENEWDSHLRSTHDVSGHNIQAKDGEIGHVDDFLIDDKTWAIRYFVIDTNNWWPGKKVLISPSWIESISWSDSKVVVNLVRKIVMEAPEYTNETLLTRDYEAKLHMHYNHKGYWVDEPDHILG